MKKSLAIALTVFALAACQKNAGNQVVEEGFDNEAVPVLFGSNVAALKTTKSAGALNAWSGQENLYIIGVEKNADGEADFANLFIPNVPAVSPAANGEAIEVKNADGKYFYYGDGNNQTYDFYGYYVDDALADPTAAAPVLDVGADNISVSVKINGRQDLLVGIPDKQADCDAGKKDNSGNNLVPVERAYSAFAARRAVNPNLIFNHKLSQFKFTILSGNAGVASNVKLAGIAVESFTTADMTVAGNGVDEGLKNLANAEFLPLYIGAEELTINNKIDCPAWDESTGTSAASELGALMLIPGQEVYKMKLKLFQDGATDAAGNDRELDIDFSSIVGGTGNNFAEPGYIYNITIVVYGYEKAEIKVTLQAWDDNGGNILIDTDATA